MEVGLIGFWPFGLRHKGVRGTRYQLEAQSCGDCKSTLWKDLAGNIIKLTQWLIFFKYKVKVYSASCDICLCPMPLARRSWQLLSLVAVVLITPRWRALTWSAGWFPSLPYSMSKFLGFFLPKNEGRKRERNLDPGFGEAAPVAELATEVGNWFWFWFWTL